MELDFREDSLEYILDNFPHWLNHNSDTTYIFSDESKVSREGRSRFQRANGELVHEEEEGYKLEARIRVPETEAGVTTALTIWDSPLPREPDRQLSVSVGRPEGYRPEKSETVQDHIYRSIKDDLDQLLEPDDTEEPEFLNSMIAEYHWNR